MNCFTFKKLGRVMLLAAVIAVGAVCWIGCGGDDNPSNNNNNSGGNNSGGNNSGGNNSGGNGGGSSNTFTDDRDGKKYKVVKIGNQTWMAENLSFNLGDSWCYNNADSNCVKYGKQYTLNMAKIACPNGWHLPSKNDWNELITFVGPSTGGKKLKSKKGWYVNDYQNVDYNGTDDLGFSALPGGWKGSKFYDEGMKGQWWSNSQSDGINRADYVALGGNDDVGLSTNAEPYYGLSVRCIKD
jgi:uncharacterized protein (TIGR02145 family)